MREDGNDVAVVATGLRVPEALKAADLLAQEGIKATVVNVHTIKPFDVETITAVAEKCGAVVTAEEHSVIGGLYSATCEALMGKANIKMDRVGVEDKFGQSGTPTSLFKEYGLTAENIANKAKALLK